jgi:hypothetical protein
MPFKKGHAKMGGRQKGTPNKATQEVKDKLAAEGCDPIVELAKMAMDPDTPDALRQKCLSDLCQYDSPKLKATSTQMDVSDDMHEFLEKLWTRGDDL